MAPSEPVLIEYQASAPILERAVSEIPGMRAARGEHIAEVPIRMASVGSSAGWREGRKFDDWGAMRGQLIKAGLIKSEDETQDEMQS